MRHRAIAAVFVVSLLIVGVTLVHGNEDPAERRSPLVTLDLRGASLEDALREVFQGTPYTFEIEAGVDAAPTTVALRDCTFEQALRAILDLNDLTYRRSGNTYVISRKTPAAIALERSREEEIAAEWETGRQRRELGRVMKRLPKGKHRLLYVTEFGDRHQVRIRVFPYSNEGGGEAVLWEAPSGADIRYILPAPDFARVLVAWWETGYDYASRFTVVTVRDAAAIAIDHLGRTEWGYWSDPTHVVLLERAGAISGTWSESSFDVVAGKLKKLGAGALPEHDAELGFLTRPFRSQLDIFEGLLLGQRLVVPFEAGEADGALVRGVGIPYVPPHARDLPLAHPCAAVAPNGQDIALTTGRSDVAVFILHRFELVKGEYSSRVDDVIPLSDLVKDESVWVSQLQWSADGGHLLFTETHFHPARFHAPDVGGDVPDLIDWTDVVRMWHRDTRQTETIALGRDAWLLPDAAAKP